MCTNLDEDFLQIVARGRQLLATNTPEKAQHRRAQTGQLLLCHGE
jgi:hypothetical protein